MPAHLQAAVYSEPSTIDVLIISSFICILNVSRGLFETLIHAGLIGEIAVGIIYGTPLAGLLHSSWETTFRDLGYIGLIIIVLEGGLQAQIDILRRNLVLSVLVAITGVIVPIGLSVSLLYAGYRYSFVDAFTGGAALAATSLGTTIALLSSRSSEDTEATNQKDLRHTRIGSILLSAALLDDVVGLILASVISSITSTEGDHKISLVEPILRPIGVSVGLFLIPTVPWIRQTLTKLLYRLQRLRNSLIPSKAYREAGTLLELVAITSAFVAASHYAGASMLLGAWVAGSILKGVDEIRHAACQKGSVSENHGPDSHPDPSGFLFVFEKYISQLQNYLLAPLFFSSVGAAIPFINLWSGRILWRGVVYSLLMFIAKACVGFWVLAWPSSSASPPLKVDDPSIVLPSPSAPSQASQAFYPALFLSLAMVSRGEISLIIAQLGNMDSEPYMVVMWAIVLCTILGPAFTGLLLKSKGSQCSAGSWN